MGCFQSAEAAEFEQNVDRAIASQKNVKPVKQELREDKAFLAQCIETLGHSFAGNKDNEGDLLFNWMFGPELEDRDQNLEERNKLSRILTMFGLYLHGYYPKSGRVLQLVDEDGELKFIESNNLTLHFPPKANKNSVAPTVHKVPVGLTVVRFYPKGHKYDWGERWWWPLKLFAKLGDKKQQPSLWNDKTKKTENKNFDKRANMAGDMQEKEHHRLMKDTPHIYVAAVAVSPDAQGQGVGSKLMRAISGIADELGLPCYLDTVGSRRKDIYARYGYEVTSTSKIEYDVGDGKAWLCEDYLFMTRPAQARS